MNQEYKEYNTHLNLELNINDAVKVTTIPQNESFWVSIEKINENNTFEGKVQNMLSRKHDFNYEDIITLEYKNIKEHKLKENRFNPYSITLKDKQKMYNKYLIFKSIYKREPNLEEIDKFLNIQLK
jgi:hypothetical protein